MTSQNLTSNITTLSAEGAKLVLAAAEQAALAKGLALSIAVVDLAGNLLSFQRVANAGVSSIEAAIRKARTAAHLGAPTKVFEDLLHGGLTSLLAFEFVTPSQGGIPLFTNGVLVGAVGCSGSSGEEDEAAAQAGAAAYAAATECA